MKKSLTKFQRELNNGFNYKSVGFMMILIIAIQLLDYRPYVGMYKTVVGKPTGIGIESISSGARNAHGSDYVVLYLNDSNQDKYFNLDMDGFKLDSSLLKYNEVKIWYKTFRWDSDDRDFHQIEADGKMIYPYDYSIFWGKVKWMLYGVLLIWFGNSTRFRERLFKMLRILPKEF